MSSWRTREPVIWARSTSAVCEDPSSRVMPRFCRHNRLVQNCAICSREQEVELRPLVSSAAPQASTPPSTRRARRPAQPTGRTPEPRHTPGLRVRRLKRGVDDGYHSNLLPGIKSSEDAERLAYELAFAATRLERLATDPPGLYAEAADPSQDLEERTWLVFLIAYLGPLEDANPFCEITRIRTTWASNERPNFAEVHTGRRTAHDPQRPTRTPDAYRAWAARAGSQQQAFVGEPTWSPERRFERLFERLALPGLHRGARYDLLVTLGALKLYEINPAALKLGGTDAVTTAAKRALGIGDPMLLERRAAALAEACQLPLASLDLALYNWEAERRATVGMPDLQPDPTRLATVRTTIGL